MYMAVSPCPTPYGGTRDGHAPETYQNSTKRVPLHAEGLERAYAQNKTTSEGDPMTTNAQADQRYNRALAAEPHLRAIADMVGAVTASAAHDRSFCDGCFWECTLKGHVLPLVGWERGSWSRQARHPDPETERWLRSQEAWEAVTERWLQQLSRVARGGHSHS